MLADGVKIVFDPTLVRGMGYYTGPIFEVTLDGYNFSIAGGGRYDQMIGKFSGQNVSACGFSIGFERIVTILKDHAQGSFKLPEGSVAYLVGRQGADGAQGGSAGTGSRGAQDGRGGDGSADEQEHEAPD